MADELELYRWRYGDERTREVRSTGWRATEADIRAQLGDRVIERVEDSREVRRSNPVKDSGAKLGRRSAGRRQRAGRQSDAIEGQRWRGSYPARMAAAPGAAAGLPAKRVGSACLTG